MRNLRKAMIADFDYFYAVGQLIGYVLTIAPRQKIYTYYFVDLFTHRYYSLSVIFENVIR